MNLPSDFLEWTNMYVPTEYTMPKNYTTDFDDSRKVVGCILVDGFYIDKNGVLVKTKAILKG